MRNAGNRKLRLVLLALALLSLSMVALGGTFASTVNKEGTEEQSSTDYRVIVTCRDSKGQSVNLFSGSPVLTEQTFWCPGRTEILYLDVTNNESFPVECILNLTVDDNEFGQMMEYAVINGNEYPNNWSDFEKKSQKSSVLNTNTTYEIFNFPASAPLTGGPHHFALAIHMSENATNEYQEKTMQLTFDLRINADNAGTAN